MKHPRPHLPLPQLHPAGRAGRLDHVIAHSAGGSHLLHQPVLPVPLPPPAQDLRPRLAVRAGPRRHPARHHPHRHHPRHPTTRPPTPGPHTPSRPTTTGRRPAALLIDRPGNGGGAWRPPGRSTRQAEPGELSSTWGHWVPCLLSTGSPPPPGPGSPAPSSSPPRPRTAPGTRSAAASTPSSSPPPARARPWPRSSGRSTGWPPHRPPEEQQRRCRVLYVSPLKALAVDVERNLRAPLTGIGQAAARLGLPRPDITGRHPLRRHPRRRAARARPPARRTSSSPRPSRCSCCSPAPPASRCAASRR